MKKFLAFLMCCAMLLGLCACSSQPPVNPSSTTSTLPVNKTFLTVAKTGKIDGAKFGIGDHPDTIEQYHHFYDEEYWGDPANEAEGIPPLSIDYIGNEKVRMYTNDTKYYYDDKKRDEGLYFVAYFDTAYGYATTSTESYVKATAGIEPIYEGAAGKDDMFFFFGEPVEGTTMLAYNIDNKYEVDFFFANGLLTATSISIYDSSRVHGPVIEQSSSEL